MSFPGLICFTNCLLPQEDGSIENVDLWIDELSGVILDAQQTFYLQKKRPEKIINLNGNILSPGFIDIQVNGAYGFDFSIFEDYESYRTGLKLVTERIVETGVTSIVPTLITQEKSLYPTLLNLLRPSSAARSATILGWHAEGPFLSDMKRGAHDLPFLLTASGGTTSFEEVYGEENLAEREGWIITNENKSVGVRIITVAPEVNGVMNAIGELSKRGIVFSIGHSVALSDVSTLAIRHGARLITHLFNAMPQLHHRDPSIIGLLGASPHLASPQSPRPPMSTSPSPDHVASPVSVTPGAPSCNEVSATISMVSGKLTRSQFHLDKGQIADMAFTRPFYGLIADGIHLHPNSVRLAYSAHPEGCILVTDAMKILDPHLPDGIHEWRDGKRLVKEGFTVYLEGTSTLAGSVVTMDHSIRNFSRFTGCSLCEAINCATYNPARCLGIENQKGTLRPGADADFVILDRMGDILSTWVAGKEVWVKSS